MRKPERAFDQGRFVFWMLKHEKIVLELAKITRMLVRFNHVARRIVNANHSVM